VITLKKNLDWSLIMLRHIVSVSLAMTACATLISTKANAATLTIKPDGEISKNPGELIQFFFEFTPTPSRTAISLSLIVGLDGSELSEVESRVLFPPSESFTITGPTIIADPIYKVLTPKKDGISDISAILLYQEYDPSGNFYTDIVEAGGADVVPEPLTIFGTVTALGLGTLFKQKSSKRRKANH
jgi:hypothetical protein